MQTGFWWGKLKADLGKTCMQDIKLDSKDVGWRGVYLILWLSLRSSGGLLRTF
jgi:hypothetical protein